MESDYDGISGKRQYAFMEKFQYSREAGTENEEKAGDEILQSLAQAGLVGYSEDFSFTAYEIIKARLTVTQPYEKVYRVTGYQGCGNTPKEGIAAPFLYVENGDEISLSYAQGRVIMMNGAVEKTMYQRLVDAKVAGFITISGTPMDRGEDLEPARCCLKDIHKTPIQGVNIHYKDAVELIEKGASQVRLVLEQNKVIRSSRNIIAKLEGSEQRDEILTLSAHYDSVPEGPGAYDNLAGAAIILELARYFVKHTPRRTLAFIWFGAEEAGLCGSQAYVKAHETELEKHRFNMNVDLAGQLIGGNVLGVTAKPSVCEILSYMMHEAGMGVSIKNDIWGSDSNSFAWMGIPAMTLNRDGFGMHTRLDTIELIDPCSLRRSASVLLCIARNLANIGIFPFAREVPKEMKEKLDTYFKDK